MGWRADTSLASPHTPSNLPPLTFSVLHLGSDSGAEDRSLRLSVSLKGAVWGRDHRGRTAVGNEAPSLPAGVLALSLVLLAHCCGLVTGEIRGGIEAAKRGCGRGGWGGVVEAAARRPAGISRALNRTFGEPCEGWGCGPIRGGTRRARYNPGFEVCEGRARRSVKGGAGRVCEVWGWGNHRYL